MSKAQEILTKIKSPSDVKALSLDRLKLLAKEVRTRIINVIGRNGGHLASNLGAVELTIALHKVFESPFDTLIWDVGHQCYTHKLLTGREPGFSSIRLKGGVSGFPKRIESVHDVIETGHSSTSISAGLGLSVGKKLGGVNGKVVSIIGDGALSGGMAFEALNHAGHAAEDLIIVLNDNNMSISPNVGAISLYLSRITATKTYQSIREILDKGMKVVPGFGSRIFSLVMRLKKGIKAVFFKESIFSDMGFEYVGPIDGHNLSLLIKIFSNVKDLNKPVVVHVITKKGKGFRQAEENPAMYHGVSPFSLIDGKVEKKSSLNFTEAFSGFLLKKAAGNRKIAAITAAMSEGTGVFPFQKEYPDRFFDVGIAEQHAITFAAGLAASGIQPIAAVYSTFMQRAVDQVLHDIAIPGLPVVIAMDRAGLVSSDGETHQGVYDIPLFRPIPGLTFLAPAGYEDLELMMEYAFNIEKPVLIRYPKAVCLKSDTLSNPIEEGRGVFIHKNGSKSLIVSVGGIFQEVLEAENILNRDRLYTDIYNLRFIKPLDEEYLLEVLSGYSFVLVVEDGTASGGIGEYIVSLAAGNNLGTVIKNIGVPDLFLAQAERSELLKECGLDRESISQIIRDAVMSDFSIVRDKNSS